MLKKSHLLIFLCILGACGDTTEQKDPPIVISDDMTTTDMGTQDDMSQPDQNTQMSHAGCGSEGIAFKLYNDTNKSALTGYGQRDDDEDTPRAQSPMTLIGSQGDYEGKSCDDGSMAWTKIPDGQYVVSLDVPNNHYVTSSNHGTQFIKAIKRGDINILTFGDSIPAYGPQPWFPAKLDTMVSSLAKVTRVNVAVPGSESREWMPGTTYYKNKLQPNLAKADVIVFSLGGNDLYNFANSLGGGNITQEQINEKYGEFQVLVEEIKVNLRRIIKDMRQVNKEADIVWILYPNYAHSTHWAALAGQSINLVQNLLQRTLIDVRQDLGTEEDLLIVDMLNALYKKNIDLFLIDPLHLNQDGHLFYAREVFKTLGGVIIEDGKMAQETGPRKIGMAPVE